MRMPFNLRRGGGGLPDGTAGQTRLTQLTVMLELPLLW